MGRSCRALHRKALGFLAGALALVATGCPLEGDGNGSDPESMVTVPEGTFLMGCDVAEDPMCFGNESPVHPVFVPAFDIDRYETTMRRYQACEAAGACTGAGIYAGLCNASIETYDAPRPDHPVNCIIWNQAREFCAWDGKRLCSEAEWEKAARGTDGRAYPWGSQPATCDLAVMAEAGGEQCGTGTTLPVGSRPRGASPYGAQDMAGNVAEWVEDDWHDRYDGAPDDGSAWIDEPRGYYRVARSCSYLCGEYLGRALGVTTRLNYQPGMDGPGHHDIGVRCCRSR